MKIVLITPPLMQPNTPYPATPLLTAWLRAQGHEAVQADLSLELLLKLFTKDGIHTLCDALRTSPDASKATGFLRQAAAYSDKIDTVILFLQGLDSTHTEAFARRGTLPEGIHLARAHEQNQALKWNFGGLDRHDRARHLCSLFLDDIAEAASILDPLFGFSRYGESISATLPTFDLLAHQLQTRCSIFSRPSTGKRSPAEAGWLEQSVDAQISLHHPTHIAISIPFPGCLFGALRIAQRIRRINPAIRIAIGGGYVNTELRELKAPDIFDDVDAVMLDSGMLPLQRWLEHNDPTTLIRTFIRHQGQVLYMNTDALPVRHDALPPPVYDGLTLDRYIGLFEVLNPVTRLWTDGRWNKLMLAHGCWWHRCAFCDTQVDYICRYDPARPDTLCDWIETIIASTGYNGFHFVDEALPPSLVNGLCSEIRRRKLNVEWWGNIRYEKHFTPPLIAKMAQSGCIAVTGGFETCNDRTLALMNKGITVAEAKTVCASFAQAGILTHAYLMYGFPTQSFKETQKALETVRRMMHAGHLHSAFWHRFALTAHSEIARHPEPYNIHLKPEPVSDFARNEIPFDGEFDHDLDATGHALRTATYNYQHGIGLDRPAAEWFRSENVTMPRRMFRQGR